MMSKRDLTIHKRKILQSRIEFKKIKNNNNNLCPQRSGEIYLSF